LGLNSEEVSSLLKDDSLDEVNEAILLTLSNESFLLDGDIPHDMSSKKHCISSAY
jgi:hypothetical protein